MAVTARAEIDETLAAERAWTEKVLSIARVAVFGVTVVMSIAVFLIVRSMGMDRDAMQQNLVPIVYYAMALVYALGIAAWVRRGMPGTLFFCGTAAVDVVAINGLMFVFRRLNADVPDVPFANGLLLSELMDLWTIYMSGIAIVLLIAINGLRNHHLSNFVATGTGVATFIAHNSNVRFDIPGPGIVSLSIIVMAGGVVAFSTERTKRMLDRFARQQLLRRYLSPAAVRRVLDEGSSPDEALSAGGRLVEVTVLASDLRGFTAMSEKLPPADVIEQLNGYHVAMLEVAERHGGMLDKFIGDGALIVFGLPLGSADPPADRGASAAIEAARGMTVALEEHNRARVGRGLAPLRMGVGIHTGPVVAGNIGAGQRLEFTVIGDAVNTASRIEGLTKEAGVPVLVSGDTVSRIPAPHGLRELGPMTIRGREAPMRIFALSG